MKHLFSIVAIILFSVFSLSAQDDSESILVSDLEVDGFENFWVQSQLVFDPNIAIIDFRQARPAGGNTAFLTHVHHFSSKLFNALAVKYPDEMIEMVGSTSTVKIEFVVKTDGKVDVMSIENGARFGFSPQITQKLFDSYRKWRPAKKNGETIESKVILEVEFSL